jgi:hypothetical protein
MIHYGRLFSHRIVRKLTYVVPRISISFFILQRNSSLFGYNTYPIRLFSLSATVDNDNINIQIYITSFYVERDVFLTSVKVPFLVY